MTLVPVFLCAILSLIGGEVLEIPLPDTIKHCLDVAKSRDTHSTRFVGEEIYSRCIQKYLWRRNREQKHPSLGKEAKKWIESLISMPDVSNLVFSYGDNGRKNTYYGNATILNGTKSQRVRRQTLPRQPRIRKEYRTLTDQERMLFHRAVNMLKADTTVAPNKFDALGQLHYQSIGRSHFGPNFLGWHRLFLLVVENALREKVASVTIPYWDTTLDDKLLDPRSSIIWTPEFLGTGNGFVQEGPFAGWQTPMGPLIRYYGTAGTMMNWTFIENVFRQYHLENITVPFAQDDNNLEEHHNQVHRWIGGHMAPPGLAAFDPVFYLLHSFVDMLWEIFRGLQKRKGIDPTTDYPMNNVNIPEGQRYNDPSGIGSLRNRHALSNVFTNNIYKYNRPPSCSRQQPNCGSNHIRCELAGNVARCVSASIFDVRRLLTSRGIPMDGSSGIREFRSARTEHEKQMLHFKKLVHRIEAIDCKDNNVNEKYVNNFVINNVANISNWAYLPVQVIYKNLHPNASQNRSVYKHCSKNQEHDKNLRVFIESNGISYNGHFKEIAHFQLKQMTSSELVYLGIKKPTQSIDSEAVLSAYDDCGRICQSFCPSKQNGVSKKCTGAVKITQTMPLMYGKDLIEASSIIWRENEFGFPKLLQSRVAIAFVCDSSNSFWPW